MTTKLKIILLGLAIMASSALFAAGMKTVHVKTPGTLARQVGDKNKYQTKALKIKGSLNADDVRFLRDMAGGDTLFNSTPGILTDIDLSEVSFIPDSGAYLWEKAPYKLTGAHTIPPAFLYKCPVEKIVLPIQLDSIGNWAFNSTCLTEFIVPDGVHITPYLIANDSCLMELRLPDSTNAAPTPGNQNFPALRKFSIGDTYYVSSSSFVNLPDIEEIIFEGLIGHIDGYVITNCPKLKRVVFRGPIASTGGEQFVKDCPELEEVRFEGLIFRTYFGEPINCPKLNGYTQTGIVLHGDSSVFNIGNLKDVTDHPKMKEQAQKLMDYKLHILTSSSEPILERVEIDNFNETEQLAEALGNQESILALKEFIEPIRNDMEKSRLQILKESPAYEKEDMEISWTYPSPSDSILTLDRDYFNLDSIAGNGDDISRIKNLMYWIHDAIRHDGGSYNPASQSLIDLYEICKNEDRGVNCRMMAIMLTEALLAEGIPARYLTCEPKYWKYDSDCHVICIAWSDSLGKWVWIDPTFAAYVTDENGLMLHPGEVRERLIADKELILNPDANWNHESPQTKENYLDSYMAKNLYYITAITNNRPRPEGKGATRSEYVLLAPLGANPTPNNNITIFDPDKFWAAPTLNSSK